MSANDNVIAILAQLALATDGALLGMGLGCLAIQTWWKFNYTSSALDKIKAAPTVPISDLRSLVADGGDTQSPPASADQQQQQQPQPLLVVVRGVVEPKPARSLRPNVLVCQESGDKGVILEKTQKCIYNEWRGLFGFRSDLRTLITQKKDQKTTSLKLVPFVLVESGQWPRSDNVIVNLDGSTHPLPLMTVYRHLEPVQPTPYTFLQAIFGHAYPVGILDEEKILPLGKEISAVGFCSLQEGNPQIKACMDLPYFLSDMTKDQMVVALATSTKYMFWGGIVLGSLSLGILGYAITRNWRRWKERQQIQSRDAAVTDATDTRVDEETEEVPEGQLCIICLMRRRKSAFVPCGHLVCCHRCALAVERDATPKCPVCRQTIRSSVRIYES